MFTHNILREILIKIDGLNFGEFMVIRQSFPQQNFPLYDTFDPKVLLFQPMMKCHSCCIRFHI